MTRDECILFLRSLPAGGIHELVAEAKVAEWDPDTLVGVGGAAVGGPLSATIEWDGDDNDPYLGSFGCVVLRFPDEPAARLWVEARAVAAGWTIAKPKEQS